MPNKKNQPSKDRIAKLDQIIQEKKQENEATKRELTTYRRSFNNAQRNLQLIAKFKNRLIRTLRSIAAYSLGRRNLKHLYSRSFKVKHAANRLKPYKYHLYNLGFIEKTLADLDALMEETTDRYLYRAIAWELALWHANKYTALGAEQALHYVNIAIKGEKDKEQLRKLAIVQAECYDRLGENEAGKQVIHNLLTVENHPDLYLAAANLEESLFERVQWINQALTLYNIRPIDFATYEPDATYDDLRTKAIANQKTVTGPLVSVILPAYNFETGIHIAIDSILAQTWENIELLIVDDCSTDETVQVVEEYMKQDPRIKLFRTPVNSGPYVARNIALEAASGEFITINDADDWSHAEKIEIQATHLLHNQDIIANTSEHARLTEELKLHRRGTPGKYIFPNMSSLLFRRAEVLETIGYWDNVRFAADGEFKRRLLKAFGKQAIVDLKTGPLSLPRQSENSLTGSSAFGYNGFFMGARKEYVESFTNYHEQAEHLYYPSKQTKRLFPVPEPMLPKRKAKNKGSRHFDVVIAGDFRVHGPLTDSTIKEINVHKKIGIRTGLIQLSCYNTTRNKELSRSIRDVIDGEHVEFLVYGEQITCDVLIIKNAAVLEEKQKYFPTIKPNMVAVVMNQPTEFRRSSRHLVEYVDKRGIWYPYDSKTRDELINYNKRGLRFIKLSIEDWTNKTLQAEDLYNKRLADWLTEENPYLH